MISKKIWVSRSNMNMSQAALARAVGVKQTTVASWEKRRTEPDTVMVGRLAQVLKITTDHLLGVQSEELVLPEGVADLAKKIADLSPSDRAVVEKVVAALNANDNSKVVPS